MIWNYFPQNMSYFLHHITLWLTVSAALLILIQGLLSFFKNSLNKSWVFAYCAVASFLILPFTVKIIGPLSVTSAGWAIYQIFNACFKKLFSLKDSEQKFLVYFIILTGFILYPLSEGLLMWDVYRWGWHPVASIIVLGMLLFFNFKKWPILFAGLVLVLLVDTFNIIPSDNIWDMVLDPFAFVGSCFYLLKNLILKKKLHLSS